MIVFVDIWYEGKNILSIFGFFHFFSGICLFGVNMFTFFEPPNFSSGHVECSFDNLAENFSPELQKSSTQSPNKIVKFCFNAEKLEKFFWARRNEFWEYQFLSSIAIFVLRAGVLAL